jgi:hypothetical protein
LNWVAKGEDLVRVNMVDFDYLITKKKLEEEDKFEDFVNRNSRFDVCHFIFIYVYLVYVVCFCACFCFLILII